MMNYKKAIMWSNILIVLAVAIAFLTYGFSGLAQWIISGAAVLMLAAALVVKTRYWRCPYCKSMLPWMSFSTPEHCMHCGKRLDIYIQIDDK